MHPGWAPPSSSASRLALSLGVGSPAEVDALFEKVTKFNPDPKWDTENPSWSGISKAGADAAKAGDLAGAKAQCKSCHKAFREKYKSTFRMKPVPK